MSASPATVAPGGDITYTIEVDNGGNPGTDDGINVVVTDVLPSNTAFASVTPQNVFGPFFDCSNSGNSVSCTSSTYPSARIRSITIVARVLSNVPPGTMITNTATVSDDLAHTWDRID